jgi:phosphoglycolate phosphatase-like HAD superfamily hydrolase
MDDYFAFDFDGVICDSAGETASTAWRAAHELWPGLVAAQPGEALLARFVRLRPVIETGYENVVLAALVARGIEDAAIVAGFPELCAQCIGDEGLERADLRRRFGDARDRWLASDLESWLDAQAFFPGVVDAINALDAPCCIITTKEDRFTRVLVQRAGLHVPADRIHALEAFEGRGKRSVLEALARTHPGVRLHFFEDRLQTLDRVRDLPDLQMYLVDWGYNTAAERAQAHADPRIELIDLAGFTARLRRPHRA